jgi:spore coat protein U-like protein
MAPLSTGVLADGFASTGFMVNSQALGACSVPSPQITGTAVNATFAGGAINITQFGGPNNDRAVASAISLQYPGTLCNCSTILSIRSKNGGLVPSSATAVASRTGTLPQNVPYTLQATWGPVNLLLDTNGSNGRPVIAQGLSGGAISGNLTLNFVTAASSSLVSQGSYHDTVLIMIGTPM